MKRALPTRSDDADDWLPVPLAAGATVEISMSFFRQTRVVEKITVTSAKCPRDDPRRIKFLFNREFETSMNQSPNHLTPIAGLLLAQKLYYCLLSVRAGHCCEAEVERFKIWPVKIDIHAPLIVTATGEIEGELVEISRRRMPRNSATLYPGIRPVWVKGSMTLARSMPFSFACFVYDLEG